MTNEQAELLPCPFCQFTQPQLTLEVSNKITWFKVICHGCWAQTGGVNNQDEAISKWNRRIDKTSSTDNSSNVHSCYEGHCSIESPSEASTPETKKPARAAREFWVRATNLQEFQNYRFNFCDIEAIKHVANNFDEYVKMREVLDE